MNNSVAEIKERLDKLKNEAVDIALIEGKKIGIGLAAVIKRRVLNKGISADGSPFSKYSDKGVPYLVYKNAFARVPSAYENIKSKVESLKKRKKIGGKKNEFTEDSDYFITYKDWREANRLNTSRKNFEFTGDMWANFGTSESVDVEKLSNNMVRITLKGGSEDSQNKIDWNSKREGKSIIEPTDDELNDAKNDFIESLSNELQLLINVG